MLRPSTERQRTFSDAREVLCHGAFAHAGGELINGPKVFGLEFRIVIKNLLLLHARCEPAHANVSGAMRNYRGVGGY